MSTPLAPQDRKGGKMVLITIRVLRLLAVVNFVAIIGFSNNSVAGQNQLSLLSELNPINSTTTVSQQPRLTPPATANLNPVNSTGESTAPSQVIPSASFEDFRQRFLITKADHMMRQARKALENGNNARAARLTTRAQRALDRIEKPLEKYTDVASGIRAGLSGLKKVATNAMNQNDLAANKLIMRAQNLLFQSRKKRFSGQSEDSLSLAEAAVKALERIDPKYLSNNERMQNKMISNLRNRLQAKLDVHMTQLHDGLQQIRNRAAYAEYMSDSDSTRSPRSNESVFRSPASFETQSVELEDEGIEIHELSSATELTQ